VTRLDVADLVVIAARTMGVSTESVLAQMDVDAAQDALAEARLFVQAPGKAIRGRADAAEAGVVLIRALLRHRPFPEHGQQVAVAAGLQFLSLNGWRADLNPASTAVVVVEALGSGQLTPDAAAVWLSPRLTRVRRLAPVQVPRPSFGLPRPVPAARVPARRVRARRVPARRVRARRALAGALLAVAASGVTLLAAACSRGPFMADGSAAGASVAGQHQATASPRSADLAYADCMRSHGIADFPYPSASGVAMIAPAAGIDLSSVQFRTAETTCHQVTPTATVRIVDASTALSR
jgi:prophage maintenance system killer protein